MSLSALSGAISGFAAARKDMQARADQEKVAARQDRMMDLMEANPQMFMGANGGAYEPMGAMPGQGDGYGNRPQVGVAPSDGLFGLIDRTEGAGNYSALFGHAQNGGKFNGVDVSKMTLGQLRSFAAPNGQYGQWVKSKVGRVATPMGRHQIVGRTLFRTAEAMGLSDDTVFSPDVQNQMANRLASNRLAAASTPAGKRAQLRAEWEGFRGVPDAALDRAIAQFEASGRQIQPRAMGVNR